MAMVVDEALGLRAGRGASERTQREREGLREGGGREGGREEGEREERGKESVQDCTWPAGPIGPKRIEFTITSKYGSLSRLQTRGLG